MRHRLLVAAWLAAAATAPAALSQTVRSTITDPVIVDVSENELRVSVDYVYAGEAGQEDIFVFAEVLDVSGNPLPGITDDVTDAEVVPGEGTATSTLLMNRAVGTFKSTALRMCMSSRAGDDIVCETFPHEKTWTARLIPQDPEDPDSAVDEEAEEEPAPGEAEEEPAPGEAEEQPAPGESEEEPAAVPLRIRSFTATPRFINRGETLMLAWRTSGASTVRLRPDGGKPDDWRGAGLSGTQNLPVSGQRQVRPSRSITYTLVARRPGMPDVQRSVRVNVRKPQSKGPRIVQGVACASVKNGMPSGCQERFKYKGRGPLKVCRFLKLAHVPVGKHTLELRLHKFDFVLGDFHPDVLGTEKQTFQQRAANLMVRRSFCDKDSAIGLLGWEVFLDGRSIGWVKYEVLP